MFAAAQQLSQNINPGEVFCDYACCHGSRMLTTVPKQYPARKTPSTATSVAVRALGFALSKECLVEL